MSITAAVLTISDSTHRGEREDLSGPALVTLLQQKGFIVVSRDVSPDDQGRISATLIQMSEVAQFVVTTGGTGLSPRDVTPEATAAVCDNQVPGIAELMRAEGLKQTKFAPLSRAICGARRKSLILNLPGNPKGAVESLSTVLHLVSHAIDLLNGKTSHEKMPGIVL
ncbi:MAG: molybdopterin adenylyltransferase [Candidatus Angelobacter sp.]|jgi:molybdopterin adenylyltransferase|nr:molybdopterin adenylyltransferase [Candidatus Angelobacter sp.]